MSSNAVILLSGGLDSATTLYYVKNRLKSRKIKSLFIDYGQLPLKEEEHCVKKLTSKLGTGYKKIDLSWLGEISTSLTNKKGKLPVTYPKNIKKEKQHIIKWWVPSRNSLFLLAALAHAESEFISKREKYDVYIGLKHEGRISMKDTTPEFVEKINILAKEATYHGNLKIVAPLVYKDKDEIVKLAKELNVPLGHTYSCYIGKGFSKGMPKHCGICSNCIQRKQAFYWANIKDPSVYNK